METTVVNGMLTVKVNMLQTVALAVIVYFFGVFVRAKVPVLRRFSIPAPVIGGLPSLFLRPLCACREYWLSILMAHYKQFL